MNRLAVLCKVFGWQGGTVYQVNSMLQVIGARYDAYELYAMAFPKFQNQLDEIQGLFKDYLLTTAIH